MRRSEISVLCSAVRLCLLETISRGDVKSSPHRMNAKRGAEHTLLERSLKVRDVLLRFTTWRSAWHAKIKLKTTVKMRVILWFQHCGDNVIETQFGWIQLELALQQLVMPGFSSYFITVITLVFFLPTFLFRRETMPSSSCKFYSGHGV